ncbi:MAG: hypothetical protein Q9209_006005 [Squamulea sp. 1 TL-2023]
MKQKRKIHPSVANDVLSKRRLLDEDAENNTNPSIKAQVDSTYGQRSAFPGIDPLEGEDNLFYGPAEDGLEYLRMVRSEAKGVPNLLTSGTIEDKDLYQDYPQGYYKDGAYTALPTPLVRRKNQIQDEEDIDPQEAYYSSLCGRFRSLHMSINTSSPLSVPDESTAAIAAKLNDGASSRIWRMTILYTQPTPTMLSQLDQETVIAGIAALERHIAWKILEKESLVGAWAWSLLARCREVGMMGSEEVGVIRDLGKKARGLLRMLAAGLRGEQELQSDGVEAIEEEKDELVDEDLVENSMGQEDASEGQEDCMVATGATEMGQSADRTSLIAGDMEVSQGIGSTDDIVNGNAVISTEEHATVPTTKDLKLPTSNDAETTKARQRVLTTLGQIEVSTLQGSPNDCSQASTQQSAEIYGRTSFSEPASSSPVNGFSSDNTVPLATRITATLDMIVTIVGEVFGQRDLLEGRMVWD